MNGLLEKIRRTGTPLTQYTGAKPFRGIVTGFNDAFLVDNAIRDALLHEDEKSGELLRPYLRGQDIRRWAPEWAGLWMIFTRRGPISTLRRRSEIT